MQIVYQQPSCLKLATHSFAVMRGSSNGLFAPCLQTDSGNKNAQWPNVRQYCWSQLYHFLSVESTDTFLIFITQLNLDFGIETMKWMLIAKAWLQFVFPVYTWMLDSWFLLAFSHVDLQSTVAWQQPGVYNHWQLSCTKILCTLITVLNFNSIVSRITYVMSMSSSAIFCEIAQ